MYCSWFIQLESGSKTRQLKHLLVIAQLTSWRQQAPGLITQDVTNLLLLRISEVLHAAATSHKYCCMRPAQIQKLGYLFARVGDPET